MSKPINDYTITISCYCSQEMTLYSDKDKFNSPSGFYNKLHDEVITDEETRSTTKVCFECSLICLF